MNRFGRRGFIAGAGAVGLTAGTATGADARGGPAPRRRPGPRFDLEEATVADIAAAYDSRELTCVELTEMYLARIAAHEDGGARLNSITTVNPDALRAAEEVDRERRRRGRRGPLHGIPVLLKDNVDTRDMATSNGSVILRDSVPPDDAFIARALRRQGALILGKASMGEFAGGSYNTIDGQVVNPYNAKRNTGGSSAGSGAAIAANLAVLAIGTDTSTSVRGPASFCGLVGLRPTTGLISRDGIAPKNLTFDTAGPMARTVTDTALLFSAVAGLDPADPLSVEVYGDYPGPLRRKAARGDLDHTRYLRRRSLRGARLGVVRDFFGGDPEIDALADDALDTLRSLGARLVDITLDPEFVEFYITGGGANIRDVADYRFKEDWEGYLATLGPEVPKTVEEFVHIYETEVNASPLPVEDSVMELLTTSLTTSTDAPAYRDLMRRVLPEATRLKLAMFDRHRLDAMVFPYESSFAAPIRSPVFSVDDPTHVPSSRPRPSTFAGYSSVGFPGIVVPMGFGAQGLPMTLSFMGRPYSEGQLLGYAYDYEQESLWRAAPAPL
ncbi:amidase family protein [Streptomyces radicis]|uniref:Amidase n=1 Tax=Streptomyces radicis TaxID=1750517 RepID=A0A3A9WGN8_9ACTN|nr:amidase family protein [Streptomyces radicis]RKN12115.1 amidase [Streptomyces radicis]RKN25832.1 amidase [Streptomyces radicis]